MPLETERGSKDANEGSESYARNDAYKQAVSGLIPLDDGTSQISDCRLCLNVHAHAPRIK